MATQSIQGLLYAYLFVKMYAFGFHKRERLDYKAPPLRALLSVGVI